MPGKQRKIRATDLGIDLSKAADSEIFKWLIACQLFAERISQDTAAKTFAELDAAGYLTPHAPAATHWPDLVDVLDRGGYQRYDESTARELISIGQDTLDKYGGSMSTLHQQAGTGKAIADKVQEFNGMGPTAAAIFLRDMRGIWT